MGPYKTTINDPEKPIGRYVMKPVTEKPLHTKSIIDIHKGIKNTFDLFEKEAATKGNCEDMLKRLELQLACLNMFSVEGDDADSKDELVEQVTATIETLKTGVDRKPTEQEWWDSKEVIDGNQPSVKYDTSTPTGYLLAGKDVFERMSLVQFAESGYCKAMEMKGWGNHYEVVEMFNEFYPRMGMSRLKAIHQQSRNRMAETFKNDCRAKHFPYSRELCQKYGLAYLPDTSTATISVNQTQQEQELQTK